MSSPTVGLGIELDVSAVPPFPAGSVAQNGGRRPDSAPQNGFDTVASDEPLVEVGERIPCVNCYHRAGWAGTSPTTWLRASVVERLAAVTTHLPPGFGLAVFDGWRAPETVRALYAHYYGPGSTLEAGYLANPDEDRDGPPPHLTGGAVDLTLTWHGAPLSLGTPFDEFSPRAHLDALEEAPEGTPDALDRDLRRVLTAAMVEAGFAPYAQEWWHFAHGDDEWARWAGAASALYGATSPNR